MIYINPTTNKMYYGGSITIIQNGVLFSGIPTAEQLESWGYEEYTPPEPPEPSSSDELDPQEALDIITGGIEQ